MATDREKHYRLYPQKEKDYTYEKIRADINCPRCKEKYWGYIAKKGRKKGIVIKSQLWSNALNMDDYIEKHEEKRIYRCHVCGYKWEVKRINIFGGKRGIKLCQL